MPAKILAIGLDGATLDVLQPLIDKGKIPNLAKIIQNGASGRLRSTFPPVSPPAWVSFMTGKTPAKHGIYDFLNKCKGSYLWEPVDYSQVKDNTLWDILSNEGKRVAVINVPVTYPPRKVNGVMISGFGTPGKESEFVYPPSIKEKIQSDYVIDTYWTDYLGKENWIERLVENVTDMTRKRKALTLDILNMEEWDFFMITFVGPDRLQHCLWHIIDSDPESSDDEDTKKYKTLITEYYTYLDKVVGEICEKAQKPEQIFILSDHGFGPLKKMVNLNLILEEIGLFERNREKNTVKKALTRFLVSFGITRKRLSRLSESLGFTIDIDRYSESINTLGFASEINWSKTKAYHYSTDGIHINLSGRDHNGIVSPGDEYENLRDLLITRLCDLRDPETGERVISKVSRREDVYKGDSLDRVPDLIITEHDERYSFPAYAMVKQYSTIFISQVPHSGTHNLYGMFAVTGKDIVKGKTLDDVSIYDLCPAMLHLSGIAIPSDIDGRVPVEIFEGDAKDIKIKYDESKSDSKHIDDRDISDKDKEEIMKSLKGLGYL